MLVAYTRNFVIIKLKKHLTMGAVCARMQINLEILIGDRVLLEEKDSPAGIRSGFWSLSQKWAGMHLAKLGRRKRF